MNRTDFDTGEIELLYNGTLIGNEWRHIGLLPEPMRMFSAVVLPALLSPVRLNTEIVVFGGFSGTKNAALSGTYWLNDNIWHTGPGIPY